MTTTMPSTLNISLGSKCSWSVTADSLSLISVLMRAEDIDIGWIDGQMKNDCRSYQGWYLKVGVAMQHKVTITCSWIWSIIRLGKLGTTPKVCERCRLLRRLLRKIGQFMLMIRENDQYVQYAHRPQPTIWRTAWAYVIATGKWELAQLMAVLIDSPLFSGVPCPWHFSNLVSVSLAQCKLESAF